TIPLPCEGYTPIVAAPAADIWYYYAYRSNGTADRICFSSDDTSHVSLWLGRCDSLQPFSCHTILPNTPTYLIPPMYVHRDTLRLQISGNSVSASFSFEMCLEYTPGIPNTNT